MTQELKVPFLAVPQIEHRATDLLARVAEWSGKPLRPPINVDQIIEGYLKLDLAFTDLSVMLGLPNVLGATFLKDRRIFIEESLEIGGHEGRIAFTMAHEVGHWELHRPLIEAREASAPLFSTKDLPEQPAIVCRSDDGKRPPVEVQADMFAAHLLMPAADVRAVVHARYGLALPHWKHVEELRKNRELDENLRDLAAEVIEHGNFSNVSNEAMRYRLLDLKLVVDESAPQLTLL